MIPTMALAMCRAPFLVRQPRRFLHMKGNVEHVDLGTKGRVWTGWSLTSSLAPDDSFLNPNAEFGSFLDIDGDMIVVGSSEICYIY